MKKILVFTLLIAVSVAQAKTKKPSFAQLTAKAVKASEMKQVAYWKKLGEFTAEFETLSERPTTSAARDWFFNPAHADDSVWCVNNGYFAQVAACDKSNRWSFDVRETETFKTLSQQAGMADTCGEGESPCSLVGGITAAGGFACANNSTRSCLRAADVDNLRRLSLTVQICSQGHPRVAIKAADGSKRLINCDPFLAALKSQAQALDQSCAVAVKAVQNLCNNSRDQLAQVLKLADAAVPGTPAPPPPAVAGDHKTDVLFIGDSHSTSCLGTELYKKMQSQTSPVTGKPVTVQMNAMCASGAASWLQTTVKSTCGAEQCTPGQACVTTPYTESTTSPGLGPLLDSAKPRLTVVQLGTNMLSNGWNGAGGSTALITKMIDQIHAEGSQCVWIGPPQPNALGIATYKLGDFSGYTAFVAKMKAAVAKDGRCTFVDSSSYTDYHAIRDTKYGVHYNCSDYKTWADGAYNDTVRGAISGLSSGGDQPTTETTQ